MNLLDLIIVAAFLVLVLVSKIDITALSLLALVAALIIGRILKGERKL